MRLRRELRKNFPGVPEHYERRIEQVLDGIAGEAADMSDRGQKCCRREELHGKGGGEWQYSSEKYSGAWQYSSGKYSGEWQYSSGKSGSRARFGYHRAAAASVWAAALVLCVIGFFTAFPAYAAGIPVLNRIVYTISPLVEETGEGEQKVAEKTAEVLKEFMESDVLLYTGAENTGDSWELNTNTLRAAYLFKEKIRQYLSAEQSVPPEVTIEVREVSARRRGYEIEAEVFCDVFLNGTYCFCERMEAELIERPGVLTVVGMWETDASESHQVTSEEPNM